ncbi:hypothetical protein BH24ACT1_BH24ACT1_04250 [soil metagenome]
MGADETFDLRVDVAGAGQPEALEIVASVHEAVTSRSQFRQTLDGHLLGRELWRSTVSPLAELGLVAAGAIPITIDLGPSDTDDAGAMGLSDAGVHPVRVELRQLGTDIVVDAFTTHLVRTRDDEAASLAVAWMQDFDAPVALQPDGSVILDDDARTDLATTATALGAMDVPLSLAPQPETLDALAAVEPGLLAELRVRLADRQVLAGPYVEVPVAALVAAGLPDVVEAERALGAATVELALGSADATAWVSEGPVGPGVLAVLDTVQRLVIPEDALVPLDRPLTLANPFLVEDAAGRRFETAAIDPGLALHFDEGNDPVLGAHHLLADLAVLAYDSPGLTRGVVVAPPPNWTPSAEFLSTALLAIADGPVVKAVTLDELFEEVPLASGPGGEVLVRTLRPDPTPPPPVAAAELRRTFDDVASVATMIDASEPTVALLERLALTSAAAALSREEQAAYRAGVGQAIAGELSQVGILSEGSFQLTSREATVPLTLVNDLDTDVDVTLELESDKLDFVPPATGTAMTRRMTMALTLAPGRTPLMVPVEARASGDFPLVITMRSPDDRLEVATTRLTIRSTFPSGVGFLLSAGAGLFLALWWARHWRTARRDRRLVAPPA